MRGCLKILGIFLGVIIVLGAIIALVFWLDWRQANQLYMQAIQEYFDGNPVEALAAYQKYSKSFSLSKDSAQRAKETIDELEDYLNASKLQQNGQVNEAVAAYEAYLADHFSYKPINIPYYFLAHKALAGLKLQKAQQIHDNGDFSVTLEVYRSVLALEPIIEGECPAEFTSGGVECRNALTAIQESQAVVRLAIPAVIIHWFHSLGQDGNYLEFVRSCDGVLKAYPEILNTPDGPSARAAVDEGLAELPAWFAANPASPEIDFTSEVGRIGDLWILTTHFREIGGLVSYTLEGTGWIIDAQGEKWGEFYGTKEIDRGKVTVPAGGEAENTYRFSGDVFIDGYAEFTWQGEDEGGNPITIGEKVHLLR